MIQSYLKEIADIIIRGDYREETFYPALKSFLEEYGKSIGKKKIAVTVLPKKTEAGNPDFSVWDGEYEQVGFIEAKQPGTNLDQIEATDQLKRYLKIFPNLILTDFYEFRLYRNGAEIDRVSIGRPFIAKKLKTVPPVEHEDEFKSLLGKYFSFVLPEIDSAEKLAKMLALKTHFLKDDVVAEELVEESAGSGHILGFYDAFQKYLISDLTRENFADLFSQTLTYGLFAARTRASNGFNRKLAYEYIPATIGILRDVFRFVSSADLPKPLEVMIDDIAEVLQKTNVKKILQDYYRDGKGEDPIVHFYETFLNHYDPTLREKRGVYYTPLPVVHYIVRSLHHLLKTKFGMEDGFASKDVKLLDPAGGTLTFPVEAIKVAVEEFVSKYGEGGKHNLIKNQILQNYYAFELMMAPYAIGHMKIGFMLEELGYTMEDDDRFNLFLTNTLDMEDLGQTTIPGLNSLSEESTLASKVKKDEPILVILGNPPYSGISSNINEWTEKLLKKDVDGAQSYYTVDGKPLGEKKLWLQDDYVKFLRFAQWKIHKTGYGMVGMITNHSYLDNPTFRGMRQSLMNTFDEIYLLDLHGNSLKKETCPDGSPDQNVFDIRQGVAIALFVKHKPCAPIYRGKLPQGSKGCKVVHTDLWGKRNPKYKWLGSHSVKNVGYKKLEPKTPWYFFIPRDVAGIQEYLEWPSIKDIFPLNVTGIVTARDKFVINFSKRELENKILQFRNLSLPDETIRQAFKLKDTRGWKLPEARKKIAKDTNWKNYYQDVLYRPFDKRTIYYTESMVDWGRPEYMRHMLAGENLSLCFMRQFSGNVPYSHFLITEHMVDNRTFFSSKGIIQQAPLYLYPEEKEKKPKSGVPLMIFEPEVTYGKKGKQPNIAPEIFDMLKASYGRIPTPEKILYYIYGVFYSNNYREKYAEFLKIDFPRVPFTKDIDVFNAMAKLGQKLSDLHLLKSPVINRPVSKYEGSGINDTIEKPVYKEDEQRVYINAEKYFSNVKPDVWNYHIGGYQVLAKYLKDRKGRQMGDPRHYCKVVTALEKTIEIQKEIDKLYPEVGKSL
ncbi:MAG: N-6 DNA methylase [Candidatus Marinimicrobia bacterium]|nr:N-6 DNA methylase [Candidatus Neomarinimicrobiota bacterium]